MNRQNQDCVIYSTGDTLVLQLDYLAPSRIEAPIFGMAIHRHDGAHISGPNTSFAGLSIPSVEGTGTVTLTIPALSLLEGLYYISVASTDQHDTEIFDYHDRCYPFRVVNQDGGNREKYGLVTLQGKWEHHTTQEISPQQVL